MSRPTRTILVLLLAFTLATTAALASPLRNRGAQPRRSPIGSFSPSDFTARLWSLLMGVWGKNGSMVEPNGVQGKNGSQADPNGGGSQSTSPATTNGDNGHQIDPDGL